MGPSRRGTGSSGPVGRSRRRPQSPGRRPVSEGSQASLQREGQAAFRAAGHVGCSHCARGPEHRPTPDAASATAHDGGAAGSGGRGPLSAPPSAVTADSASRAGFAGGHEAPLVRAGSALGPTRSRVQDRKLGPRGPEGHGHRFTFASSGLSAGSCRRGTRARGAASCAGRPVLSATQTLRGAAGPCAAPFPGRAPGQSWTRRCLHWKLPTGTGASCLFFFFY